jgi:hypothetical protein
MSNQIISLNGHVKIQAWEKQDDGTEKEVFNKIIKNLVVDVGKDSILKYLGNMSGGGYVEQIGVGDDTTAAASGQTDLQASTNKLWKSISATDRVYVRPTLFISVDFGYTEANFTWNELGLRDNQGTPLLWDRQIDATPLVKTSSKRAIVEWQLSL